jgi:hypothetical protein
MKNLQNLLRFTVIGVAGATSGSLALQLIPETSMAALQCGNVCRALGGRRVSR